MEFSNDPQAYFHIPSCPMTYSALTEEITNPVIDDDYELCSTCQIPVPGVGPASDPTMPVVGEGQKRVSLTSHVPLMSLCQSPQHRQHKYVREVHHLQRVTGISRPRTPRSLPHPHTSAPATVTSTSSALARARPCARRPVTHLWCSFPFDR